MLSNHTGEVTNLIFNIWGSKLPWLNNVWSTHTHLLARDSQLEADLEKNALNNLTKSQEPDEQLV